MMRGSPSVSFMETPAEFIALTQDIGVEFEDGDVSRLGRYLELLLETNQRMNLTRIVEPADAWIRHIYDSLTLLPMLQSAGAETVADIGSGGGAPVIPLAICCPTVRFTMVESIGKKAAFLRDVVSSLNLDNCEVITERAETIGIDRETHREQYDVVTARAVGPLNVLLELTVPLAAVGGFVFAIKGERAKEEINAARGALHRIHAHVTETVRTATGTIVVIQKQRTTPKAYPRRPGEPKRNPLS